MPRPKSPPRVTGPYYHTNRARYFLRVYEAGLKPQNLWFKREEEAIEAMRQYSTLLAKTAPHIIGDVLDEYMSEKLERGQAKPETCTEQRANLLRFLADHLEEDISSISPQRATAIYQHAVQQPTKKTGKPMAAATHRFYLKLCQGMFAWAVRKEYLKSNPFDEVTPVGRVSAGKTQLRIEEAKRYREAALRMHDEGNVLALAAVMPLYLGLRASEVLKRKVRDVDCAGGILWIGEGKTKNARRHLVIKAAPLRERLAKLVAGRGGEEPLFGQGSTGKPLARQVLHKMVTRICQAAGVPVVCPHSLRGLWATLSVESGAAESAVAAALGHGSFEVTARHYAQPEALSNTRSARVLDMLDSDSTGATQPVVLPPAELAQLSPEQILAQLPPGMLAKLIQAAATQTPPAPARTNKKQVRA